METSFDLLPLTDCATPLKQTTQTISFFTLPPELRHNIYSLAVLHPGYEPKQALKAQDAWKGCSKALLLSRRVHFEAIKVLYSAPRPIDLADYKDEDLRFVGIRILAGQPKEQYSVGLIMKLAYITIPIKCDWRGGNRPFVKIAERVHVFLNALEEHSTALRKVRLQAGDSDMREANWAIGHNVSETREGYLMMF